MFQHALNDSASVGVCRKALHCASECIDDELNVLGGHSLDGFLNDVVSILVFHTSKYMIFKFFDQLRLLVY